MSHSKNEHTGTTETPEPDEKILAHDAHAAARSDEAETAPAHARANAHHEAHIDEIEPKPDGAEPDSSDGDARQDKEDKSAPEEVVPLTIPAQPAKAGAGWWHWVKTHKKLTIPGSLVLILAILAAVPATRYAIAGSVLKQDFKVAVVDSQTGKPVTNAAIDLRGKHVLTDNKGLATIHVAVGSATLTASKQYYRSSKMSVRVPILKPKSIGQVMLMATGRQVPVTVLNRITGKPVVDAQLGASGTEVRTDANGQATLVLPADAATFKTTVTANNYNSLDVTVKVTTAVDAANSFQIVPAGKLYFLSNASGKIDVVKTNLDGTARQTVLAGTGSEDAQSTVLLASRDWKYLALLAKRTTSATDFGSLFLIDTSNDQLTSMDSGNAGFTAVGWDDDSFIYKVHRNGYTDGQPKEWALKAYDATAKKIVVLDESNAAAPGGGFYWSQSFGSAFILGDQILYTKSLYGQDGAHMEGVRAGLYAVKADGSNKVAVKEYAVTAGYHYGGANLILNASVYDPHGLYFQANSYGMAPVDSVIYKYDDGKVSPAPATQTNVYADSSGQGYATYLDSPNGSQTFWSAPRDGKNSLYIGNEDGDNARTVLSVTDYQTYGWYTDAYVLLSKNGSELYLMGANTSDKAEPIKVTDYYRPAARYYGYGGGYGGL